jgi:hypothetical protein
MTAVEDVYPPGHGTPEDPAAPGGSRQAPAPAAERKDHRDVWEALIDVFEQAAGEPKVAEPIGKIEHDVLISSQDVPGSGVLLVCRDGRIEVRDAEGGSTPDATIEMAMQTPDIEKLTAGDLRTAMAIADGRATYSGPVRQFLRVLPLVQAMVNPPDAMGTNSQDAVQEIV